MDRMWEMQIQVYRISENITMKHRDLTKYNEDKIVPILPGFG